MPVHVSSPPPRRRRATNTADVDSQTVEVGGSKTEWEGDVARTLVETGAWMKMDLSSILGLASSARYSRLARDIIERVAESRKVAELENKLTTAIQEHAGQLDVLTGSDSGKGQFSLVDYTEQGVLTYVCIFPRDVRALPPFFRVCVFVFSSPVNQRAWCRHGKGFSSPSRRQSIL